ncbi:MAG: type II secretion system protein [Candidatus Zixiibacteriota bacterium]
MKSKFGFTLVEIMVVIVLLGILAGIGLMRYSNMTKRAKIREPVTILKKMWEMSYTYYVANGEPITSDGTPLYFGIDSGDPSLDKKNSKKLFNIGFDDQSIGVTRFYYVNTDGAIVFAFPKTKDSPFNFSEDEIDGGLSGIELGIDNDGRIYIYEDGKVREFE